MGTDAQKISAQDPYGRFCQYCSQDPKTKQVMERLAGCDPVEIFGYLRIYLENKPDLNIQTKEREKATRAILRTGAREHDAPKDVSLFLHERADRAFDTKRKGVAHLVEALARLEFYIELKTGKPPTAPGLTLLIEATQKALDRFQESQRVDPGDVRKELKRFKEHPGNAVWLEQMRDQVRSLSE